MNPNSNQPSFELPTPMSDPEQAGSVMGEKPAVAAERPPTVPNPTPPTVPPVSLAQPSVNPLPVDPSAQTPLAADDSDLIEKEWVDKAKRIVASTKDDPYTQNKEISRFKADYMKKRYNKDIKVDES